ncbi:MAG: N-formylglutamate amidohydrolase [Marinosulfonomonas sp.]|nr:N-formylglutamate amidohydrolase [Marinosulfonomonas sp.]
MTASPFKLQMPRVQTTSVVFASPHSGRNYPRSFLSRSVLDERVIRSSEDAFVDVLFDAAPRFGAPFLTAIAPRAYVDLNRGYDELDPALISGVRQQSSNPRVSSGLGVIPRVVANGRTIYDGKLRRSEAADRITNVWHPYHERLQGLLSDNRREFGQAILIDCHSMPHEAIETFGRTSGAKPDIILGDRFGSAASTHVVEWIEAAFERAGLSVARNAPFAGAYTAQHYGRPSRNQHVVQVEIDRALYMNEQTIEPNENFNELKAVLTQVIAEVVGVGAQELPLVAE